MPVRKKNVAPEPAAAEANTAESVAVEAVAASAPAGLPTAEGVLRDTQAVVREAMHNGDHRTALKGLEMLGKHFGLFADKAEADAGPTGQVLIYQLPDNGRTQKPLTDKRSAKSSAEKK
ncbi:MAG: hypothetical protein LBV79_08560 [Candidatus Adiutrix sp.]|jgi:hypothetical protein|nr:hypothetical protein [Candidatus Adiutrix sp.]